jgi:hypothetical protein
MGCSDCVARRCCEYKIIEGDELMLTAPIGCDMVCVAISIISIHRRAGGDEFG